MATPSQYTALLGYDPREDELARRKLWAGMYGAAQSPWEKIGLGLSQLGGALFDKISGDDTSDPVAQINKVATEASQQFTPNSADYYKYIAENVQNPTIKTNAAQLYQAALSKETKQTREDIEFVQKNPDQLATELQTLTTRLENRAKVAGWTGEGEVPPEIQAKLEKTPEYKKILQLSNAGQTALMERERKIEKEDLTLKSVKSTINLNEAKLKEIGTNLDAGMRWNMEREAAIETFKANNLDYTKPLDPSVALTNPSLVTTQKMALRKPWTGGKETQSSESKGGAITASDKEALKFLLEKPNDPQAAAVRKKLEEKGIL